MLRKNQKWLLLFVSGADRADISHGTGSVMKKYVLALSNWT